MAMFDIGLTAEKSKKWELANLIEKYRDGICQHSIVATSDIGILLNSLTKIRIALLPAGSEGGYVQMARLVSNHNLKMVIFIHDLKLNLEDPGVILLLQACSEHNIPFANNITTAEFILHRFLEKAMATYWRCPESRYIDFVEV